MNKWYWVWNDLDGNWEPARLYTDEENDERFSLFTTDKYNPIRGSVIAISLKEPICDIVDYKLFDNCDHDFSNKIDGDLISFNCKNCDLKLTMKIDAFLEKAIIPKELFNKRFISNIFTQGVEK